MSDSSLAQRFVARARGCVDGCPPNREDHAGKEVDLVIEREGRLMPIKIKTAARPRLADTEGLNAFLDEYPDAAPHGILIHAGHTVERLTPRIWAVPLSLALGVASETSDREARKEQE